MVIGLVTVMQASGDYRECWTLCPACMDGGPDQTELPVWLCAESGRRQRERRLRDMAVVILLIVVVLVVLGGCARPQEIVSGCDSTGLCATPVR